MKIERIKTLRGPNRWFRGTAHEATLVCDNETRAGVFADMALELQRHASCAVFFNRVVSTREPGVYLAVVQYTEEAVGRQALEYALAHCLAQIAGQPFDVPAAVAHLQGIDENVRLGPSTGAIVEAAIARGIPYRRLTDGSMVQFGWGSRGRRILAAETDRSSAIAESIAQDKDLTKMLLDAVGVPVPQGRVVDKFEAACEAMDALGGPVVVKPRDGNQGKGVVVNISHREQLRAAFEAATDISSEVIVERYMPGKDFRLLVIGDKLVAAARRDPPQVTGDGVHTIAQLVHQVNQDPLRGEGHATSLTKIRLDETALALLAKQNLTPDSILPVGTVTILRNNANLSTGGTATDVTDQVHPDLAARTIDAAQMVGLDICGVDLVCEDISRPLEAQGGGIVEVNAAPGLRMHLTPSYGQGRPVGEAIVSMMFEEGDDARIPLVAVTGTNGKTTTIRLVSHILATQGLRVGMTNSDGVYINGRRIDAGDCSGPRSARNVLLHPDVDAAVLETARGGILREGLGFDRCDVAIVTNIGVGDHLGLNHIHTSQELASVKRVLVENVAPTGTAVLNAADPLTVAMAAACPGGAIFFATTANNQVLRGHRAQGGRVAYVEDDRLVFAHDGGQECIALQDVPLTQNGRIPFQVENALAALAAAWALGLDWSIIRRGAATFVNDAQTAPGRFNLFDYRGATLIADYGHNPDAIVALVQAIETMSAKRRFIVISGAGDRRDEDLRAQTNILGSAFDHVILYEDKCQRGRQPGEVIALLREGLNGAARVRSHEAVFGELKAIDRALEQLEAGDLCLILIDQVDETLEYLAKVCGR
ncbi:MAG: cyanophycin synthetase [Burkholderiaceae bacterium]